MQSMHIHDNLAVTLAQTTQSLGLEHSEVYCRQQPNMAQGAAENSIFLTVTYEVGLQTNRHDDNSCGCAVMMMQRKS
jgi:hypothetical protein